MLRSRKETSGCAGSSLYPYRVLIISVQGPHIRTGSSLYPYRVLIIPLQGPHYIRTGSSLYPTNNYCHFSPQQHSSLNGLCKYDVRADRK
jgi:hypothetical protein